MKYHKLYIQTDNSFDTFNSITNLLGLQPTETEEDKASPDRYSSWLYEVGTDDEDPYYDFINSFLDILEPKFADLEILGVTKDNILFWFLYEYDKQCAMEFHPQEMLRLGQSGIHLNIDCWPLSIDESTTS